MKILYKFAIVGSLLLGFSSCEKQSDTVQAIILDSKDITNEGCGYLLLLEDSGLVKPGYLPSAYQHNGMKVFVNYQHTGIMDTCDFGSKIYDRATITNIKQNLER